MKPKADFAQLEAYFQQVQGIILCRQHWVSGLLPASTAVTAHGNYTDAWVRDNVYSIMAVWGLALAYRKVQEQAQGPHKGRAYLLEQSVVKLMRGLLAAMMRQAPKVEKFKHTQNPMDALHAKYDTQTGNIVVGDHEWGHLQLDATSLYLLMLAQMTESGLRIIFTIDEVNFVQNLVHYISRTYRTPDYGIWERGNKINHGIAELNASSVGMAKAALEALSGFNLFGKEGGQAAVVHVISDDIARTRITLEALLPRESLSKEVDAALLSITGFPAFAVENQAVRAKTEQRICQKLEGRYGLKRFLLDGHQTVLEDKHRLHYNPNELKQFQDIECEWPLFFCYLLLNHLFTGHAEAAASYRAKLDSLLVEQHGQQLLPELYLVPKEKVMAEKAQPHSQTRAANDNIPLVWAQSLYLLACLIQDGLLDLTDIDPLGRRNWQPPGRDCTLQVAIVAEDSTVQADLSSSGIHAQTLAEAAPIQIRDASELAAAYQQVGRNDRYGLTGRPLRQLRTLATSKMYILSGEKLVFLPQFLNQKGFYLAMDNRLLIQRLRLELAYIHRHWDRTGNPLVAITIKQNMLASYNRSVLLAFINELQQGQLGGIPIKLGDIAEFTESANHEKIDYLHDFQFPAAAWQEAERPCRHLLLSAGDPSQPLGTLLMTVWEISDDRTLLKQLNNNSNLFVQLELLSLLAQRHSLNYQPDTLLDLDGQPVTVRDLLEEVYVRAGNEHAWYVVRRCAGLLGKYDINLEQAATDILVRQHLLTVGRAYSGKATLTRPTDSSEILAVIRNYNTNASEQIIIQELILYLGMLVKSSPELFADMHTVRVGHILQLILARQKRTHGGSLDEAFNAILFLSPFELAEKVRETLADYSNTESQLSQAESLKYAGTLKGWDEARFSAKMETPDLAGTTDWYDWRERQGSVGRENDAFYADVWTILHHCKGLMVGDKLNSKRRLDSEIILSQMTSGELTFKQHVSHLLNKIQAPVYRQLTVEAIKAIATIFHTQPVYIDDTLITDVIIGHAVRISWLQAHPEHQGQYDGHIALAWQAFYQLPPHRVANGILDALAHLLHIQQHTEPGAAA